MSNGVAAALKVDGPSRGIAQGFMRDSTNSTGAGGGFGGFSATSWSAQTSGEHNTTCTSVKEYAYEEEKNLRFRPQMEDSKLI